MKMKASRPKASRPLIHRRALLLALLASALCAALAPSVAQAAFTRPFLRQITGIAPNQPFERGPGGLSTDAEDNLWVGDRLGGAPFRLDQFSSPEHGNEFLQGLEIEGPPFERGLTPPERLAINRATGTFYTAAQSTLGHSSGMAEAFSGTGVFLKRCAEGQEVAVDNSSEPTAGTVYAAFSSSYFGNRASIHKFNANCEPEPFTGSASYISGNEITGTPSGGFGFQAPGDIATGPNGNIYVMNRTEVDEYMPSGVFVRAIGGEETPGLGGSSREGGWGGSLEGAGIAVDPTTGHVLVGVQSYFGNEAAVDEFDASGHYVSQITETAAGGILHSAKALAVDSHGNLYVEDYGSAATAERAIDVYGPGAFLPSIKLPPPGQLGPASALFGGSVNPEGRSLTECTFEYLPSEDFVDEVQTLTIAAGGGNFNLAFAGQSTAGAGTGDLLGPATGTGDLTQGANLITSFSATTASLAVGEEISGEGIPAHTTILALNGETLTLSANATASGSAVSLSAASDQVTNLNPSPGANFIAGEQITGAGIPAGTSIVKATATSLTLSAKVTASGSAVALASAIAYQASMRAAELEAILEALPGVGAGNLSVSGEAGAFKLTFEGDLGDVDVPQVSGDGSGLTPSGSSLQFATQTQGSGWGDAARAACEPGAGEIPPDDAFHAVHAQVTALTSGTTYRLRLSATSSGALSGTGHGGPLAFTAPHAPSVTATHVENVSSTFANFAAQVDPLGADTTYRFQYLTQAAYEADGESFGEGTRDVPATPVDIGSGGPTGSSPEAVLEHVGGLVPGTAYRLRVLAENDIGATPGAAFAFTTLPTVSPGLPDGRRYELLTPPDKGDSKDMFATPNVNNEFTTFDFGEASGDGNHFLLDTTATFGPFPASGENSYVFTRTPSGWTFTSSASPSLGVQSAPAELFDPRDFSTVAVNDYVGSNAGSPHRVELLGPPGGAYTTIHADTEKSDRTAPVGASHDLANVVYESHDHTLAPGDTTQDAGTTALYAYSAGHFSLLNVNSTGKLLSRCGAVLGRGGTSGVSHNAVSADGSRAIFTAPDPYAKNAGYGCWDGATANSPQLYLRSGTATVELSSPEAGVSDPSGRHFAAYAGASEDGTRVFFLTQTELTREAAEDGIHGQELYEWRAEGVGGAGGTCAEGAPGYVASSKGCLSRVSAPEAGSPSAGSGAAVATVPAVSADGAAVYFTAAGRLTRDAPAIGSGEVNLYRFETATGTLTFVTTVGADDYPTAELTEWAGENALKPEADWYTTPDGRYLLFSTRRELTGYSTAEAPGSHCAELNGQEANGHCYEVYRYDSASGQIACLSCDPSGAAPASNAFFARSAFRADNPAGGPTRALSNDGAYAFFDTADPLVPQDTNGTLDVYEWHEGRISLISSGRNSSPSYFLGQSTADVGGESVEAANVFFGTHSRLVPADVDTAGDLYDARIGGGFPPPPSREGECEGDACSHPAPAPTDETPSSLTFHGPGNEHAHKPRRHVCPRGMTRRQGRCVRRHANRHKRAPKRANRNRRIGR